MSEPAANPVPRLVWLLVATVSMLSLAFVLPRQQTAREAAISMKLPDDVSFWATPDWFQHWKGYPMDVSKAEHEMLAEDTEFEKQNYILTDPSDHRPIVSVWHGIQSSIVLSGHDLNDSIHRPERCLPAQGFKDLKFSKLTVRTPKGDVPIVRISCYSEKPDETTGKPVVGKDDQPIRIRNIFYYWFVGSHSLTAGHYDRTLIDMKDRLLGGFDQRWAYVLLGAAVTDNLVQDRVLGGDPTYPQGRSEEVTDSLLGKLVEMISRDTLQWDKITR